MRNRLLSIRNISIISRGVLDPKYNKVFVNVFGAERNKSITMKFITDITGLRVADLTFINRYGDSDIDYQTEGILDIRCNTPSGTSQNCIHKKISPSGEQFLIEIQKSYQRGFAPRLLYYRAKLFSSQVEPGETDVYPGALKNVVVIGICNGGAIMHNKSHISHHMMLDTETKKCELEGITFHFIDLKKFRIKKNELEKVKNASDVWCYYLKYIHQLDIMERATFRKRNPGMERAIVELERFSLNKEEYEAYLMYCMEHSTSLNSAKEYAEDMSKQKVKEKLIETAKKLLAAGVSKDVVCKALGLKENDFE